jgi:mannose-6-phosphate isomerase
MRYPVHMKTLSPLTFAPIFKSNLWGGRRLPEFVGVPAPHADPIGEAWMLSDVAGSLSVIANGPHAGRTLRELIAENPTAIFGEHVPADGRFPLLFKFIDARQELSVQVHPNDEQAARLKGPGQRGKTEAWVILDADPATSRLYAGFKPGMTAEKFRDAMAAGTTPDTLHSFTPKAGDCVFLEAGTVHAIGASILLFEVQQTSDITYRLFDWNRVDDKTKQPRELHIDAGLACANFAAGPCDPVTPTTEDGWDELVACRYFSVHHRNTAEPLRVGCPGECRVLVCLQGEGTIAEQPVRVGDVVLIPAAVGEVEARPRGQLRLLEIAIGASC